MSGGGSFFDERLQLRDADKQKRKQARTGLREEAVLRVGQQPQAHPCTLVDIGTGGLSLLTKQTLYVGDVVEIECSLATKKLALSGTVARVSGKNVGVQFNKLSDEDLSTIQHFIHETFFQKERPPGR